MTDDDKRKSDREPVTLFVEYEGADDLVGDLHREPVERRHVRRDQPRAPDRHPVQLVLSFPGLLEPIAIEGTVRWTRGRQTGQDEVHPGEDAGAGIEFEPGPARDQLAGLIDKIRQRDPKMVSRLFRVLVVEDNRHVATLIQDGLQGLGPPRLRRRRVVRRSARRRTAARRSRSCAARSSTR